MYSDAAFAFSFNVKVSFVVILIEITCCKTKLKSKQMLSKKKKKWFLRLKGVNVCTPSLADVHGKQPNVWYSLNIDYF